MSEQKEELDQFKQAIAILREKPFDEVAMESILGLISKEIDIMNDPEEEFIPTYFIKLMRVFRMEILRKMKKMKFYVLEDQANPLPAPYRDYLIKRSTEISAALDVGNFTAAYAVALTLYDELSIIGG